MSNQTNNSRHTANVFSSAMILSAAGDAFGFKNGEWEFCYESQIIVDEVNKMGFNSIRVAPPQFIVSDDTVMHMATAKALIAKGYSENIKELFLELANQYVACMRNMNGRMPGACSIKSCAILEKNLGKDFTVPYSNGGGGCGAAMRSMCIGLLFSKEHQLHQLVAVAVEAGRMTHNHPTGYLGSVASAAFASFALRDVPLCRWGYLLLHDVLPLAWKYVEKSGRDLESNKRDWSYFEESWASYLSKRNLLTGQGPVKFPENYDLNLRDSYFQEISFSGWPGSSGHDATIIAYEALLIANNDWRIFCDAAVFHGGDNDSTAAIAAFCFAICNQGFSHIPVNHYQNVEFYDELKSLGEKLYALSLRL